MTKDELKLAFQKAFQMGQDYWYHADHEFESYNKKSDAIRAKFNEMVEETIKEALAQPEPTYHLRQYGDVTKAELDRYLATGDINPPQGIYTTPPQRADEEEYLSKAYRLANELRCHLAIAPAPQRTWVGLDEEDDIDWEEGGSLRDLVEAVEAKLKEKNTRNGGCL